MKKYILQLIFACSLITLFSECLWASDEREKCLPIEIIDGVVSADGKNAVKKRRMILTYDSLDRIIKAETYTCYLFSPLEEDILLGKVELVYGEDNRVDSLYMTSHKNGGTSMTRTLGYVEYSNDLITLLADGIDMRDEMQIDKQGRVIYKATINEYGKRVRERSFSYIYYPKSSNLKQVDIIFSPSYTKRKEFKYEVGTKSIFSSMESPMWVLGLMFDIAYFDTDNSIEEQTYKNYDLEESIKKRNEYNELGYPTYCILEDDTDKSILYREINYKIVD